MLSLNHYRLKNWKSELDVFTVCSLVVLRQLNCSDKFRIAT